MLGASGAGKSSFLKAGLLARLRRDDERFLVLTTVRPARGGLTGPQGLLNALGVTAIPSPRALKVRIAELRAPVVERLIALPKPPATCIERRRRRLSCRSIRPKSSSRATARNGSMFCN